MLKITISGATGSGKTSISILLERLLMDYGFDVMNNDDEADTEIHQEYAEKMAENLKDRNIVIETKNVKMFKVPIKQKR